MLRLLLGFLVVLVSCIKVYTAGEAVHLVSSLLTPSNFPSSIGPEEGVGDNEGQRLKRGYYVDHDGPTSGNWGGKMMSKLKRRTSSLISSAPHQHHGHGDSDEVEDSDMAGAFWNLYGSGGGYSGGGGGYGKYVNKSAVGLLGFLSLLSLIQNGLSTTTAAAPAPAPAPGRRRRSNEEQFDRKPELISQQDRIIQIVLPMLVSVDTIRSKGIPLKCVLLEVCQTNRNLVDEFQDHGRSVGVMLDNGLTNILRRLGTKDISKLRYAGKTGRNGKDCSKFYETCKSTVA